MAMDGPCGNFSRDLTRQRDQRSWGLVTLWKEVYHCISPLLSYHPAKFGGHRNTGSRDVFSLPRDFDV